MFVILDDDDDMMGVIFVLFDPHLVQFYTNRMMDMGRIYMPLMIFKEDGCTSWDVNCLLRSLIRLCFKNVRIATFCREFHY